MSRVVITGGHGLIGSAIAAHLTNAGHGVTIIDDQRTAIVDHVPGTTHMRMPVERAAWTTGGHWDTVIHAAAPVGPVAILTRDVLDEMLSATRAAINIARVNHARLIALSSSEVHGTEHPTGSLVVPDEWSHRAEYCVGKIATEHAALRYQHETGRPVSVIRPWNITGPAQSEAAGFAIARFAHQAARGEPLTVYLPGTQRRAFMSAHDLAVHVRDMVDDRQHHAWGQVVDAAAPQNAVSMVDLADMFGFPYRIVDPSVLHGPAFREAAAGSKLPPDAPGLPGWTPLSQIVADAIAATRTTTKAAA